MSNNVLNLRNDPAFARMSNLEAENFKIERSQSVPQTSTHGCFPLRLLQHENVGGTHTPIFVATLLAAVVVILVILVDLPRAPAHGPS